MSVTKGSRFDWQKCSAEGCTNRAIISHKIERNPHKYCHKHLEHWRRNGHIIVGRHQRFEGRHKNMDGYIKVYTPAGYQYEHIILAEKALGRKLPKNARVHHMNEIRDDNHTPLNLVICPNEGYHQLLHKRMRELKNK